MYEFPTLNVIVSFLLYLSFVSRLRSEGVYVYSFQYLLSFALSACKQF